MSAFPLHLSNSLIASDLEKPFDVIFKISDSEKDFAAALPPPPVVANAGLVGGGIRTGAGTD